MDSRTPQNTPANNAPISSRAQAPGVDSIKEGMLLTVATDVLAALVTD